MKIGNLKVQIGVIGAGFAPALARMANEAAEKVGLVGIANMAAAANDEWFEIAPLGKFPHEEGLQQIDLEAVKAMANEFNSVTGRFKRAITGLPIYQGHPDRHPQKYPDRRAYGWVTALEARPEGLFGRAKWSPEGKAMLENGHFKFHSPYWMGAEIGQEKGRKVYRPLQLVSLGLTNTPNLPVAPLANEGDGISTEDNKDNKENKDMEPSMKIAALAALLGMANSANATEAEVITRINQLNTEAGKLTGLANDKTKADTALENERTEHVKTKTALAAAVKQRNEAALDLYRDKITPAEREGYLTKLANDYDGAVAELKAKKPTLKTKTALANEGSRRTGLGMANDDSEAMRARSAKVQGLVNEKMNTAKVGYTEAFRLVRLENEALFAEMQEPETENED